MFCYQMIGMYYFSSPVWVVIMAKPQIKLKTCFSQVLRPGQWCFLRISAALRGIHNRTSMQVVAPKKARLAAATAEFEELQAALAAKKTILKQVEEKLSQLQDQLSQKGKEKAGLEAEVNNCENVTNQISR